MTTPTDHLRAGGHLASLLTSSIRLRAGHVKQVAVPAGKPALTVSDHFTLITFFQVLSFFPSKCQQAASLGVNSGKPREFGL